jgi:hypothetical protein
MKTRFVINRIERRNRKFADYYKIGPNKKGSYRVLRIGEIAFMFIRFNTNNEEGA